MSILIGWIVQKALELAYSATIGCLKLGLARLPFTMVSKARLKELEYKARSLALLKQTFDELQSKSPVERVKTVGGKDGIRKFQA